VRCGKCGQEIERLTVETLDVVVRPAWFSRTSSDRVDCYTTMCGLGNSEEIPPTQFHAPPGARS
jgi:hypothetical protein